MRHALMGGGFVETRDRLGEGGEGIVYSATDDRFAVKVFHRPLAEAAARKLMAMVSRDVGNLSNYAAWPQRLIVSPNGAVCGLVMPRAVEPFDIHTIYAPRDRVEHLPDANFKFLVLVATNICACVHAAHAADLVIGDLNHGSFRVGKNANVRLVDCDSFQLRDANAVYRCEVGVDAYTPPELQGQNLSTVDRMPAHDRFGLAVLIFQLLFMGRHPFSGVPAVKDAPTDIAGAIKVKAYAYGGGGVLTPPPAAPHINLVSPKLRALFVRAFTNEGAERPTPAEWHNALTEFSSSFAECPQNRAHLRPGHLGGCPWCAFVEAGVEFFPEPFSQASVDVGSIDVAALQEAWARVEAAMHLAAPNERFRNISGAYHALTVEVETRLRAARKSAKPDAVPLWVGRLRKGLLFVAPAAAFVLLLLFGTVPAMWTIGIGLFVCMLMGAKRSDYLAELRATNVRLVEEGRRLSDLLTPPAPGGMFTAAPRVRPPPPPPSIELKRQADGHYAQAAAIAREVQDDRAGIRVAPREHQLKAYLAKFPIVKNCAPNIGDGRLAQLASFGIQTAGDVERTAVMQVPGFGAALTDGLLQWRRRIERGFRFDPNKTLDAREIAIRRTEMRNKIAAFWHEVNALRTIVRSLEAEVRQAKTEEFQDFSMIDRKVAIIARLEANLEAVRVMG